MNDFYLQYGDEQLPVMGDFPETGGSLPSFMLVDDQKADVALGSLPNGPKLVMTLLSLDEDENAGLTLLRDTRHVLRRWPEVQLVVITVDSPSSLARHKLEDGLPNVVLLSTLRGRDFHKHYGVLITEYPLSGYTAPALFLVDAQHHIHYSERLSSTLDSFHFSKVEAALQEIEHQTIAAQQAAEAARLATETTESEE